MLYVIEYRLPNTEEWISHGLGFRKYGPAVEYMAVLKRLNPKQDFRIVEKNPS